MGRKLPPQHQRWFSTMLPYICGRLMLVYTQHTFSNRFTMMFFLGIAMACDSAYKVNINTCIVSQPPPWGRRLARRAPASPFWISAVGSSAHNSHLGRHFPRLRQHTTVVAGAAERDWLKSGTIEGERARWHFPSLPLSPRGDRVCAVKRLNYPRISGIQTEGPRRGPSTGDQRDWRGVRWTGGKVEHI